jgi:hypothetical protein
VLDSKQSKADAVLQVAFWRSGEKIASFACAVQCVFISACDSAVDRYEPDMSLLVSKEPTLTNGVFQLNFGGRVRVRSLKVLGRNVTLTFFVINHRLLPSRTSSWLIPMIAAKCCCSLEKRPQKHSHWISNNRTQSCKRLVLHCVSSSRKVGVCG